MASQGNFKKHAHLIYVTLCRISEKQSLCGIIFICIFAGEFHFDVDVGQDGNHPQIIFTENDTNFEKLYGSENTSPYVKDAFHNYVVNGKD